MVNIFKTIPRELHRRIKTYTTPESILVLGPGLDMYPYLVAREFKLRKVIAYDRNEKIIHQMENKYYPFVEYTSKMPSKKFDLVISLATFHENPEITTSDIASLTKPGGHIGIIDYDMHNFTIKEFFESFGYISTEYNEMLKLEKDYLFELHTSFGLEDCIRLMHKQQVKHLDSIGKISSFFYQGFIPTKHFLYIGEKSIN